MDNPSRAVVFIFAALAWGCSPGVQSRPGELPDIVKWAHPDANLVGVLTAEPAECLRSADSPKENRQILLGKIAFRSPYLLGGQAARQRLSCDACHTNGHINQHFFIEGLSGAAGSADVSNFHFSKSLGDGVFNPKPIPSLRALDKPVGADATASREAFILRLIEKEFDGTAPSTPIKHALLKYVDGLGGDTCSGEQGGIQMLSARLVYIDDMISLLASRPALEADIQGFVRAALRVELGRLYRRFPNSPSLQQGLETLSEQVKNQAVQREDWLSLKEQLLAGFGQSLFDPDYIQVQGL